MNSVKRNDELAGGYEQEQAELKQELAQMSAKIDAMDVREDSIRRFIEEAQSYVEIEKLTPELIQVFIRRIEVYEKPEKYSSTCGNSIVICFTFQMEQNTSVFSMLLTNDDDTQRTM